MNAAAVLTVGLVMVLGAVLCIFGVAVVSELLKSAAEQEKRIQAEWDAVGNTFHLQRGDGYTAAARGIRGTVDGFPVSVWGQAGKVPKTIYEVGIPLPHLQISPEWMNSSILRLLAGEDVHTGDPTFDDQALLRGSTADLRALLDAETRAALLAVFALGGWVADGKIRIERGGIETNAAQLQEGIHAALALARRLAASEGTPTGERLAAIASADPHPGVRRNAFLSLIEVDAPGRAVESAISSMLSDPDAENRLLAASVPRADRVQARRAVAGVAGDPHGGDDTRARAIAALGDLDGIERADDFLDTILSNGGSAARTAAIEALGRRRCDPSRLSKFLEDGHGPLRVAVANALAEIGTPAVQPLLLAMCDDTADPVRIAAVRGLGVMADVGAVEKLLTLMPGFFGGELKNAAEEAVSRIQSRAAGAGAGQLSVSHAPAGVGALSSGAPDGALSAPSGAQPSARKTPA